MRLFVESNFILELALQQQEHSSCEALLEICATGSAELVLPSFSIGEPLQTLARRARERRELEQGLAATLSQLRRTARYEAEAEKLREVVPLLAAAIDEERERLDEVLQGVLAICKLIPLDRAVVTRGRDLERAHDLKPEDAIVASSVLGELEKDAAPSCFVTRNSKDFGDPDLVAKFDGLRCKLLFSFKSAADYLKER